MTVFLEKHLPAERLFVFGAGHVARPLAALAATVGFEVTVVDERAEWLTEERFPGVGRVLRHPADVAATLDCDARTFACVTTHDHPLDQQIVELLARQPLGYLGMIGSRRKRERFRMRLKAAGALRRDRADANAHGPAHRCGDARGIAVSVVAELVAVRRRVRTDVADETSEVESEDGQARAG